MREVHPVSDACARWVALSDRQALGEALDAAQEAFLDQHARTCPMCRAEQALWTDMATLVDAAADELGAAPATRVQRSTPRAQAPALHAARGRRRAWAVAVLAACAALALVLARREPQPVAQPARAVRALPSQTEPAVRVALTSGGDVEVDGRPTQPGARVGLGSLLFARSGSACLTLEHGIRVCLAQGGLLRVAELSATSRRLELRAGKLAASLDPQPVGHSFGIVTREGSALAIGTAFSVEVPQEGGEVVTRVVHGTVLVRGTAGSERRVGAHQAASMRGALLRLSGAAEARERALFDQAESAPRARPGSLRVASEPAGADVLIDERLVGVTPLALLLEAGEHVLEVRLAGEPAGREILHVSEGEQLSRSFTARAAPDSGTGAVASVASRRQGEAERDARARAAGDRQGEAERDARDASHLLSAARERRARGDLDGALRAYRELFERHGDSSEALAAHVAYAEMLLAARADPEAALASFERYLTRGGPLAREASFGRVRALRALGRSAAERVALAEFLRSFPDGPLADALRARERALGDP